MSLDNVYAYNLLECLFKSEPFFPELYEYCLKEGIADKNLIAKWKKPGYENLCCLRCIQTRDTNFATNCVCRVPKSKLEEVCCFYQSNIFWQGTSTCIYVITLLDVHINLNVMPEMYSKKSIIFDIGFSRVIFFCHLWNLSFNLLVSWFVARNRPQHAHSSTAYSHSVHLIKITTTTTVFPWRWQIL